MNTTLIAASQALPLHCLVAEKTVPVQPVPSAKVSLHELVSGLVQSLLPLTIKRRNLVLNEISRDLRVGADENMLAYVLWNLINGAIQSTQNECLHIEATTVGDRLMILIKDVGTCFHHTISREYRQVQHVAEKLGGSISIENGKEYGTNAAFYISNNLVAA
jgi:phosphoglycerate-specific signal transduction histidine kinase